MDSSAYDDIVERDTPVAFYRMNETTGSTFADSSGHGYKAQLAGKVALAQRPLLVTTPHSDGASFAAGYASETATWTSRAVTAECWIRPAADDVGPNSQSRIFGNAWTDHDGKGFMLWINRKALTFSTGWTAIADPTPLVAGNTYHIVGTFDSNDPTIRFYVNGVMVAHSGYGFVPSPQLGDAPPLSYIGALNAAGKITDHFQGAMSDCAIYDHALTAHQVAMHYQTGAGIESTRYVSAVRSDSPLAYYRMNDGTDGTFSDASGNGHPAPLTGKVALQHPALIADDPQAASASFASGYATESVTWTPRAVTAECWIRPTAADLAPGFSPRLFGNAWADNDGKGFMLWIDSGHAKFYTGWSHLVDSTALKAGAVYHIVGTFDPNNKQPLNFYVNGQLSASDSYGFEPTPQSGDSPTSYFGVLDADKTIVAHFGGDMSDCAIYDHALSASQVANHYAIGTGTFGSSPSPSPSPAPSPTPSPTATPSPVKTPFSYNAKSACINGKVYTNDVLPSGVGEFTTNGLNQAYWGGLKTRTALVGDHPGGSWGPGFLTSWGRHQYDTYFADAVGDATGGPDPFYVGPDAAVPGSPRGVRIMAEPVPSPIATSLSLMANDQWVVASATAPYKVPTEGGSLSLNVTKVNGAQNGWKVGMGFAGGAITFIGTLTSGGATPSGNGSGGSNPWTISNIHIYSGTPGTVVTPGSNDEGGLRAYNFPAYYSGVLDTNINQEYGFFIARLRLPPYLPALSPAFWTLETGGVADPATGLQRNELDIEEMFGATSGNALNAGEILWNTSARSGGVGIYPFPNGTPQSAYHDYGVLQTPQGTTFYLDGSPITSDTGEPDWTQGSADKELMLMFQVAAPGSWLDRDATARSSNPWPQYMWAQWLRVYRPTAASC